MNLISIRDFIVTYFIVLFGIIYKIVIYIIYIIYIYFNDIYRPVQTSMSVLIIANLLYIYIGLKASKT